MYVYLHVAMHIYTCFYMSIHTSTYTHIYIHTSTSICPYIQIYISLCISIHLSTSLYIYIHLYTSICIYVNLYPSTYIYICLCTFMCAHISVYICRYTSVYISIYIHIYTYVLLHACEQKFVCSSVVLVMSSDGPAAPVDTVILSQPLPSPIHPPHPWTCVSPGGGASLPTPLNPRSTPTTPSNTSPARHEIKGPPTRLECMDVFACLHL